MPPDAARSPGAFGPELIAPPKKKRRSSVERAVVWTVIAVLLVLVLVELRHARIFDSCLTAGVDAVNQKVSVSEAEIKTMITGYSEVEEKKDLPMNQLSASREEKYTYPGLFKDRFIYVYYGVVRDNEPADVLAVLPEAIQFFSKEEFMGLGAAAGAGMPPP